MSLLTTGALCCLRLLWGRFLIRASNYGTLHCLCKLCITGVKFTNYQKDLHRVKNTGQKRKHNWVLCKNSSA